MTRVYILPQSEGWLPVSLEPSNQQISIPEYLAVDYLETRTMGGKKRDFFKIMEGVYRNKNAWVDCTRNQSALMDFNSELHQSPINFGRWLGEGSHLSRVAMAYRPGAHLILDRAKMRLTYPGGVATVEDLDKESGNEIHLGLHPVQIPDFFHDNGSPYSGQSAYATSWFHIGLGHAVRGLTGRDRYLHTGGVSLGCVTMRASEWTRLYQAIIQCRVGNGVDVGYLRVV